MKLRQHRGSLEESMPTTIEIEATKPALLAEVRKNTGLNADEVSEDMIHVDPYGFDNRIGWDTHIVTIDGYGVYGFTDGPLYQEVKV